MNSSATILILAVTSSTRQNTKLLVSIRSCPQINAFFRNIYVFVFLPAAWAATCRRHPKPISAENQCLKYSLQIYHPKLSRYSFEQYQCKMILDFLVCVRRHTIHHKKIQKISEYFELNTPIIMFCINICRDQNNHNNHSFTSKNRSLFYSFFFNVQI